jgi:hypothetical protein
MARELDWLALQTAGKEYWTVVSNHQTHPKGEYKYPFPTLETARRFSERTAKHPGISDAKVLDPEGRIVLEFVTKHKHEVSWEDTGNGMREVRKCPYPKECIDC